MHSTPTPPDARAAARWLRQTPAQSPWLHEEVARRMMQRLDCICLQPAHWLHWHPAHGGLLAHEALRARWPQARASVHAGSAHQPEAALHGHIDMLWANMVAQHHADLPALLAQWRRCLSPQGFLMFSVPGPRSLHELRALYGQCGWPAPCQDFMDMQQWGELLLRAGFADPVLDVQRITLSYSAPQHLLAELRTLGRNLHPQRDARTRSRSWLHSLHAALQSTQRDDGTLPLSIDILYGHAVQGHAQPDAAPNNGETSIALAQMRAMLRG